MYQYVKVNIVLARKTVTLYLTGIAVEMFSLNNKTTPSPQLPAHTYKQKVTSLNIICFN